MTNTANNIRLFTGKGTPKIITLDIDGKEVELKVYKFTINEYQAFLEEYYGPAIEMLKENLGADLKRLNMYAQGDQLLFVKALTSKNITDKLVQFLSKRFEKDITWWDENHIEFNIMVEIFKVVVIQNHMEELFPFLFLQENLQKTLDKVKEKKT